MITYIIIAVTLIVSIICFSNRKLFHALSLSPYKITKKSEWYRAVTHGFVHADYTHLLVNMFVLWSFGTNIEYIFGNLGNSGDITNSNVNFILLYFGGLIFSSIPDIIRKRNQFAYSSIGASGAVSAVLFASIFFHPWGKILFYFVPIPAILFGVFYIWYESYMARRMGGNVNHGAHLWGAAFGFIFNIVMNPKLLQYFISELLNPKF